jgi:hypothetical protein
MGLFASTGKSERSKPLFIAATDDMVSVLPRPTENVCKKNYLRRSMPAQVATTTTAGF